MTITIKCPECNDGWLNECLCGECGGTGKQTADFESLVLSKRHPQFARLSALQVDARVCRAQHVKLKSQKPEHADSYDAQLEQALQMICAEAERWLK